MKTYSVKEFAKLINVCERTLYRWDKNGIFKAAHTPSGKRVYYYEHYLEYCEKFVDYRKEDTATDTQPLNPLKKGRPPETRRQKTFALDEEGESVTESGNN